MQKITGDLTFSSTKKKKTQAKVQIHESHTTKIRKQKDGFPFKPKRVDIHFFFLNEKEKKALLSKRNMIFF